MKIVAIYSNACELQYGFTNSLSTYSCLIAIVEEDGYSAAPIECGDCPFTTHYESQMFSHVKVHMGKEDKVNIMVGPLQSCGSVTYFYVGLDLV